MDKTKNSSVPIIEVIPVVDDPHSNQREVSYTQLLGSEPRTITKGEQSPIRDYV